MPLQNLSSIGRNISTKNTAAASASATTTGAGTGVSGGKKDATTTSGGYYKGMTVFTIAKGGLMYEVSVAGQKFRYKALKR
jgi:hypothetical protein